MKVALGLLLGVLIGVICRLAEIPLPAPPALVGALLVLAMSVGYTLSDQYLCRCAATTRHLCGGPTGHPTSSQNTGKVADG
jgi:XapX domain-containing protein